MGPKMLDRFWILLLVCTFMTGSLTGCASFVSRHREDPDSLAYEVQEAQGETEADASAGSAKEKRWNGRNGRLFGRKREPVSDDTDSGTENSKDETDPGTETEKKKRAPKGFLYGGLSSEAREIEDSLYGS